MYVSMDMYMFLFTQRLDLQSIALIGKEEGIKGYWKGNLPQVCSYCPVHLPFPSLREMGKKKVYTLSNCFYAYFH